MEFKDYYNVMGVSPTATPEEIKRAYRRLARKYHPDVSKESNAEAHFKEVGEAYEVLKDPAKRKEYDHLRQGGFRQGQDFTPPPGWDTNQSGFQRTYQGNGQFSDFFEFIFGKEQRAQQKANFSRPGQDIHYKMPISLHDAYHGETKTIQLQEGAETRTLKIKIPPGVTTGQHIRLAKQGGPGFQGGSRGDLYLEIEIQPDPHFQVAGHDITMNLSIMPWEAALGATVTVPTLNGKVQLKIPPNSQTGNKMRLKGKGLPGKTPGDQFIILKVTIPKAETEEQKNFYKKMAETFSI